MAVPPMAVHALLHIDLMPDQPATAPRLLLLRGSPSRRFHRLQRFGLRGHRHARSEQPGRCLRGGAGTERVLAGELGVSERSLVHHGGHQQVYQSGEAHEPADTVRSGRLDEQWQLCCDYQCGYGAPTLSPAFKTALAWNNTVERGARQMNGSVGDGGRRSPGCCTADGRPGRRHAARCRCPVA